MMVPVYSCPFCSHLLNYDHSFEVEAYRCSCENCNISGYSTVSLADAYSDFISRFSIQFFLSQILSELKDLNGGKS